MEARQRAGTVRRVTSLRNHDRHGSLILHGMGGNDPVPLGRIALDQHRTDLDNLTIFAGSKSRLAGLQQGFRAKGYPRRNRRNGS
jgi:hypothetical protein